MRKQCNHSLQLNATVSNPVSARWTPRPCLGHAVAHAADASQRGATRAEVLAPASHSVSQFPHAAALPQKQALPGLDLPSARPHEPSACKCGHSLAPHVAVPARLAQRVAREQQAGPLNRAFLHRLCQAPVRAARVTDSGEAPPAGQCRAGGGFRGQAGAILQPTGAPPSCGPGMPLEGCSAGSSHSSSTLPALTAACPPALWRPSPSPGSLAGSAGRAGWLCRR